MASWRTCTTCTVVVKKGEKLRLRYGVLLHSADSKEGIDLNAAYQQFLEKLKVE
jgi:hypothetical protein